VPFVGGLGADVNLKIPLIKKSTSDKIIIFLLRAVLKH
jgi:hypothetical protein